MTACAWCHALSTLDARSVFGVKREREMSSPSLTRHLSRDLRLFRDS